MNIKKNSIIIKIIPYVIFCIGFCIFIYSLHTVPNIRKYSIIHKRIHEIVEAKRINDLAKEYPPNSINSRRLKAISNALYYGTHEYIYIMENPQEIKNIQLENVLSNN